jgi:hypothetical protein
MQASEVPGAVAAASWAASSLALTVDVTVVLHDSNKLTLRLLACDVVARVAPAAHQVAQFEIELARRLADTGCPVAALENSPSAGESFPGHDILTRPIDQPTGERPMTIRQQVVRRGLAAVAAAALAVTFGGAQVAQAGSTNKAKGSLVVYNNNIENIAGCDGNYDRFISYLKKQSKSPDIFTVQQISNRAQLDKFTKRLSDELPGTYRGVIAVNNPGSMGYKTGCSVRKNQQTNAVIYRTGRFALEKSTTWRSDAPQNYKAGTGPCRDLTPTESSQDRVVNVAVRLRDRVTKDRVSVASIHWPTNSRNGKPTWNGHKCAAENMQQANAAVDKLGGTLKIVAGDTNATKGVDGWWNKALKTYMFHDAVWDTTCSKKKCPDSTSTLGHTRIDFLLVKSGHGFSNVKTITSSTVGGKYSGHNAVRAYVKY